METYKFNTKVLENGMIKIPDFLKFKLKDVEVLLRYKTEIEEKTKEEEAQEFLDKWFGFFSEIDTDDIRYNAIIGKDK